MTNRKSHRPTCFRLVPKSSTLDDLERTWTAKTHSGAEKMRLLQPPAQMWIKIDPYCQRHKCRPMSLVSGNIRYRICGYSQGFLLAGASNESGVVDDGHFWRFGWLYFFGNFRDKASSIIWRYATPCRPVIDCKIINEWPRMTLSGYAMS